MNFSLNNKSFFALPRSSSGRIGFDVYVVNLSKGLKMGRDVFLFSVLNINMQFSIMILLLRLLD